MTGKDYCCTGNCQQGRSCPLRTHKYNNSPTTTFLVGLLFGAVAAMLLTAIVTN